jgi:hypothetical protein
MPPHPPPPSFLEVRILKDLTVESSGSAHSSGVSAVGHKRVLTRNKMTGRAHDDDFQATVRWNLNPRVQAADPSYRPCCYVWETNVAGAFLPEGRIAQGRLLAKNLIVW